MLSVDENREQTKAIHQLQRRRQTLAGLLAAQDRLAMLTLHRNAQRLLRPLLVANPYAESLTFLDDKTRALKAEYEASPLYFQAVETAIATFASRGLVVAYRAVFNDDAKRWRKLGFKEIPRSELLVRRVKRIRA